MRNLLCLSVLIAALALPGLSVADQAAAEDDRQSLRTWLKELPAEEPCFGDSSESDEDLNEGNRITEEEILLLINPPRV